MKKYLLNIDSIKYLAENLKNLSEEKIQLLKDTGYVSIITLIQIDLQFANILKNILTVVKIPSYLNVISSDIDKALAVNINAELITSDKLEQYLNIPQSVLPISFSNIEKQERLLSSNIEKALDNVLQEHKFIGGSAIGEVEKNLSKFIGNKHTIMCSNGSDALILALLAIDVQRGDEIIVPALTFFATASGAKLLGCKIKFADVDLETYTILPQSVEKLISEKTVAIIPVGLYGQSADLDELEKLVKIYSKKYNRKIYLIEDAAQNFGATYKNKKSCALTDIAVTSFFPAKPLGAYGDAGAIFTDNDNLAKKIRALLIHGQYTRYVHEHLGINGRCDTLQAAIINEKLKVFPDEIKARNAVARQYNTKLANLPLILPKILKENTSTFAQYSIMVENSEVRTNLISYLAQHEIPTSIHYPVPLPQQPCFKEYDNNQLDINNSYNIANRILSLPMNAYLSIAQINFICSKIGEYFS